MSFSNPVVGGQGGELVRESIKSPDFVPGVSGWIIRRDGSAEFNNVNIRFDLTTGSIVVGPPGFPQVIIDSTPFEGRVRFPTNNPAEVTAGLIEGEDELSPPGSDLRLTARGPAVVAGDYAYLQLNSGNAADLHNVTLALNGLTNDRLDLSNGLLRFSSNQVRTRNEFYIADAFTDGNFPTRVARGKTFTGSTATALGNGTDTLVTDAQTPTARLVNGVAYKVTVQIRTASTAAGAVAGTNGLLWKLWDGAVGGTQLGNSVQKFHEAAGTNSTTETFTFLFQHTGTTGNRTVNLSGQRFTGTNNMTASVSNQYFMIIERIGDPARITNL